LKTNRLLAGTLALVLVAGLASPAFAQVAGIESTPGGPISPQGVANPQHGSLDIETIFSLPNQSSCNDILTAAGPSPGAGQDYIPNANNIVSLDVELRPDSSLASAHPITVNIYDGSLSITAANNLLGTTSADLGYPALFTFGTVHFDFAAPVPLTPGQPHVIQLVVNDGSSNIDWAVNLSDVIPGQIECVGFPSAAEYLFATYFDEIIVNGPVGGELIPIETTSLLLAGVQSFSWMIPVILSVVGIGLFVVSRKNQ